MYLDHIAIDTNDLERLKDFYVEYFGGRSNEKYHNKKTGLQTYFLAFEGGARLELMQRPGLSDRDRLNKAEGLAHLAFRLSSRDKVDALTNLLVRDGYTLKSAPRVTGDGYYESCILDPDSNEIELVADQ